MIVHTYNMMSAHNECNFLFQTYFILKQTHMYRGNDAIVKLQQYQIIKQISQPYIIN